ncbi:hypothetical protein NXH76_22255 [Blautia schinkii]|nr:hypothetical protein [Blautia schinkii]
MEILKNKRTMWEKFYRTLEAQEDKSGRIVTLTLNPSMIETLIVDGLTAGEENELHSMTADIGGLGIEVSRILAGCGYTSMCAGFEFSTDKKTQEQFMQMLKLPFHFAEAEGKMRSVVQVLNKNGQPVTLMKERPWSISQTALKNLDMKRKKVMAGLKPDDLLIVGGSIPPGVPDNIYRTWISEAKLKNVRTVFCAEGSLLKEGLKEQPYAVVIHTSILADYVNQPSGSPKDMVPAAQKLIQQGISMVCVYNEQYETAFVNAEITTYGKAYLKDPTYNCGALPSIIAGISMAMIQKKEALTMNYVLAVLKGTLHKPGNGMCTLEDFAKYFSDSTNQ